MKKSTESQNSLSYAQVVSALREIEKEMKGMNDRWDGG